MADDTQEKLDVAIKECIRLEKENAALVQALRSIDGHVCVALAGTAAEIKHEVRKTQEARADG